MGYPLLDRVRSRDMRRSAPAAQGGSSAAGGRGTGVGAGVVVRPGGGGVRCVRAIGRYLVAGLRIRWPSRSADLGGATAHRNGVLDASARGAVLHGIGHLKNWRVRARHHGRRERTTGIIQAAAGLLSYQQITTLGLDPRM